VTLGSERRTVALLSNCFI